MIIKKVKYRIANQNKSLMKLNIRGRMRMKEIAIIAIICVTIIILYFEGKEK